MMETRRAGRTRRRLARACLAAAVICVALAGFGTAAAQEEDSVRPDVFSGSASAQVVSAFLDRDALLPVNDAFRFIALDGVGTYESSNQTARASIFYPGNALVSGPGLACGAFGGQFPEEFAPLLQACTQYEYPLTVFADSLNPDGASSGSTQLGEPTDPISARAASAVAHAGLDASTTDAAINNFRVLGLPAFGAVDIPLPIPGAPELDPSVIVVDSATSTTDQRIDEAGRLVVQAVSVLDGVKLVGGLVRIDSIRSTATIVDDGIGGTTREAELEVGSVTVGGIPAQITDEGLVVGSPGGADGPLAQELTRLVNDLVKGFGVRVTTLAVEDGVEDSGVAFARSGGVLVEFDVDARGLPLLPGPQGDIDPNGIYTGVIVLGQAGATGLAAKIEDPPFEPGDVATPDLSGSDGLFAGGDGFEGLPPGGGFDDVPAGSGFDTPDEMASSSTPAGPGQRVVSISEALAAGRIALAYLAFTLTAFAVCIGPRFVLPARLPGSAP